MLAAAEDLLARGHAEPLVSCLYDACLHAALALLAAEGIEASTHRGVRHLLAMHFVKEGRLPRHVSRDFARLLADRDLAHYGTAEEFEGDVVRDTVRLAADVLRPVLASLADLAPGTGEAAGRALRRVDALTATPSP
jgi:uncharacterized protein (UPF0332 family)